MLVFAVTSMVSSVLTLATIALDQFVAVAFPIHARFTRRLWPSWVISGVWILAAAASIPFLKHKKLTELRFSDHVKLHCSEGTVVYNKSRTHWQYIRQMSPNFRYHLATSGTRSECVPALWSHWLLAHHSPFPPWLSLFLISSRQKHYPLIKSWQNRHIPLQRCWN